MLVVWYQRINQLKFRKEKLVKYRLLHLIN